MIIAHSANSGFSPGEDSMGKRQILVVDDETAIRDIFENALGQAGYPVVLAGSAEEALEVLKKTNIHIMFIDLKLPGMSGIELCEEIRKTNHVPIIYAMTGNVGLFELSDCRRNGFDDHFPKPFSVKLIVKLAEDASERLERWADQGSLILPTLR